MATSYTSLLGLALPVTGELQGTWGDTVNNSITQLCEDSIAGVATASVLSADWTLTTTGLGAANQARMAILIPTGAPGVSRNIIAPSKSKIYTVINQSNANVVIKGAATTGVTITSGDTVTVAWNGSDFSEVKKANGTFTNLTYTGTLTGGTGIVNIGSNQIYKDASGNVGIGKVPSALLDVNGSIYTGSINTGNGISTGPAFIELGGLRSGAGIAYIDFHAVNGTDNEARIARNSGANGSFDLTNTGTGALNIVQTGASPITFLTSLVEKARFDTSGYFLIGATTASGTNLLQVNSDVLVNGLTVGKGLASVATNTALGVSALGAATTGNYNTAVGYQTLQLNNTGVQNTAFGGGALLANTSGNYNTAVGVNALVGNTSGVQNCAFGLQSMTLNTIGTVNNAFGFYSLFSNTIGTANNAFGRQALTTATSSVATLGTVTGGTGYTAGTYTGVVMTLSSGSTAATYPTATIVVAGGAVTTVTITSPGSGFKDTTTVLTAPAASIGGTGSGFSVPVATLNTAASNSAFGDLALQFLVSGVNNTALGASAGRNTTTGSTNLFVGTSSGSAVTTGSNNVIVGSYTGSAAPISATGSNYIVLSDGAANIRQVIDSAGNVGINTTTPSSFAKLAVLQTSGSNVFQIATTGNLTGAYWNATDSTSIVNKTYGALFSQGTQDAQAYAFITNNTERMRILSTGEVGIGNSAPGTKLDVTGVTRSTTFSVGASGGTAGFSAGTISTNTNWGLGFTANASPALGDFVFLSSAGTERMRISSTDGAMTVTGTGSPFLGTSSLAGLSNVYSQNTSATGIPGVSLNSAVAWTTAKSTGQIRFDGLTTGSTYTVYSSIYSISGANSATGAATDLAFNTSNGAATAAERMRLTSGGFLGIATASPANVLHVADNGGTYQIRTSSSNGLNYYNFGRDSTDGYFAMDGNQGTGYKWLISAAEKMRLDSSGNLGIGTSSPTRRLDLSSSSATLARFTGNNANNYIEISDDNNAHVMTIGAIAGGNGYMYSTGYLALYSGSAEKIRIDSTGNVGIGTTSPTQKLQVTGGNAYVSGGQLQTNRANASGDTTAGLALQIDATTQAQITSPASGSMAIYTNSSERVRIDSTGNVGVGTASPAVKLAVSSTDAILIPNGTTLQRPTGAAGYIRYNSTLGVFEGYTTAWTSLGSGIATGTTVATTSGTAIDFTGIPSTAKRITVMFNGTSTTGTSNQLIQIGSGSVTTTGYVATCGTFAGGPATGITSTTIGFNINTSTAAETVSGIMTICLMGSNLWVASHSVKTGTGTVGIGGGSITLAGALDRVRLTSLNGTDTFDAGSVNIMWE